MSSTERPHWIDVGGGAVERAEAAALGNGVDRGFRGVVGVCPWGWKALSGPLGGRFGRRATRSWPIGGA